MIPRTTPRPTVPDAVMLQWANGKPVARPIGRGRFVPWVGWHIEVGKDAALDELLLGAGFERLEFKHQRPGGSEIVQHWDLGQRIDLLPVTSGPPAQTIGACLANGTARETAEAGLGLHWPTGERSQLAVRGIVRDLWAAGYRGLVQLTTKSRMTDWLLRALLEHTRVAVAADDLVDRQKYPDRQVSPAELWLPLTGGEEAEFGKGDTATVVPIVSAHPAELDREYLRGRWRPDDVYQAAAHAWPLVQAWAREYQLTGGRAADEGGE